MLIKYSVEEILERAEESLTSNTKINNFYPGSIARSIIEAIAYEIGHNKETDTQIEDLVGEEKEEHVSIYAFMEQVLNQGFLSKADDTYLDLIGTLFSYERREEHIRDAEGFKTQKISDDTYRLELGSRIQVVMSSNETAIRLELLGIDGVMDLIPHEYALGTGSFVYTLIESAGYYSQEVLNECREAIRRVKAYGVRGEIQLPDPTYVDLVIRLVMKKDGVQEESFIEASLSVEKAIEEYITGLNLGEPIIYYELASTIMTAHEGISDFVVEEWRVDQRPVLLGNQNIEEDQRFILNTVAVY